MSWPLCDRANLCRGVAIRFIGIFWMLSLTGLVNAAEGEITAEERAHWAFQPIVRPSVPGTDAVAAIDAFLLEKLDGQSFAGQADRRTLIRRLKLDLLGLPPTPAEVEEFVEDDSSDAYERLVDRFLASPHYGERWGRHWLDLVRYAETDGYNADGDRPLAYRYRDYVIEAFNRNTPYDRFVAEQLAGDEMYPGDASAVIATSYLRLWPDENNASDVHKSRQDTLNDITTNVGSVFLGLTLGCAQCHDHKFDPILQTDFYELQAYFAGIVPDDRVLVGTPEELRAYATRLAEWEERADPLRKELYELELPARQKAAAVKRLKFPAEILEAIDVRPEERTTKQRQFAFWAERQVVGETKAEAVEKNLSDAERERRKELQAALSKLEKSKPKPPGTVEVLAVTDSPMGPAESYLLLAGAYDAEFDEVRPKGLTVLEPVSTAPETVDVGRPGSSGRRAALATWLTDSKNPLPARVMVNRIWQGHLGRGLVPAANDFGVQFAEPVHLDLLNWLSAEFIASGWDIKHLHRLIVSSDAYRQSGTRTDVVQNDPDNELLWHFPRRRLEAETIRDSLLAVSGQLVDALYGPSVRPELPAEYAKGKKWDVTKDERERNRRSAYIYAKRNLPYPFLAAFDLPDMFESCAARVTTTTAPQALTMLNDQTVLRAADALARRLLAERDSLDAAELVERAFALVLGRLPESEELHAAIGFISGQEEQILEGEMSEEEAHAIAVADFCHALMNVNEFLCIE